MGSNVPPASSLYAAFASPLGAAGVPACKRQTAQARLNATLQLAPKSISSVITVYIRQGFEASAYFAGE